MHPLTNCAIVCKKSVGERGEDMAKYDLSVRYYGEALEDNSIPVKELAPSLLALSEAFQEIQFLENPDEPPLSLDIKATEKGSFKIDLLLINGQDILNQAINFLNGNESNALSNLVTYVTIFGGAIKLIKCIAKSKVKKREKIDEGSVKITFEDKTTIEIPEKSIEATKSIEFRRNIKEVIKPLESEGINGIDFYHEKEEIISIKEEEAVAFEVPEKEDEELETTESEVYLQIINVAFEHGKWKFSNGTNTFYASIQDEGFIDGVKKNQQQFGSTDTLKVKLLTSQKIDKDGKLKSEFTVLKVIDHIKGHKQLELDLG